MNQLKYIFFIIYLFSIIHCAPLKAEKGHIQGRVFSLETNKPLPGASVRIERTAFGAIANKNGLFKIHSVKSGNYTLIVSLVGYKQKKIDITIPANDTVFIECFLEVQAIQTEDIIVSASKRVQLVQEVQVSVSTISSSELMDRNITKLDEVLGYIPGVSMNGDHISIRGSSGFAFGIGSRVILLLDGFPLLSGDIGDIKFDAMPIFDINRIEIIKGAGSSLYGTNALGGVINVITKEPLEQGIFKIRTFAGIYTKPTYEQWEYSKNLHKNWGFEAGYSKKINRFSLNASASYIEDESYLLYNDSRRYNIFSKMKYDFGNLLTIGISGSISSNDKADWVYWHSLDSATRPPSTTDQSIRINSDKYMLFADAVKIFDNNNFMTIKSGIYATYFKNTYPQSHTDYRQSDANAFNNELQYNSKLFREVLLTSGINYTYHDVKSHIYGNCYQYLLSLFEQMEYQPISSVTTTAGFRIDYEQSSSAKSHLEFSPKIGATYQLDSNHILRFSAGRGFRSASIAERFATVNFQGFKVIENPNLKSEVSWTFEIGGNSNVNLGFMNLSSDASIYYTRLFDLIEPTFIAPSYDIIFNNITNARIYGIELSTKGFVSGMFGFETALTLMEPKDLSKDETLKYRHQILWYNKILVPLDWLEIQFEYRYMSKVERIDEELKFQVKDYDARVPIHILDARFLLRGKAFNLPFNIAINTKNMLNYHYTYMVGNLAPTRYIGLQIETML